MEIPQELVDWVAHEGQEPTLVVNPCFIPPSAVDELAFYHPGFGGGLTHALRHVLGRDDNNRYFARADSLSGNWHEKMADVMQRLRLYPAVEEGRAGADRRPDRQSAHRRDARLESGALESRQGSRLRPE